MRTRINSTGKSAKTGAALRVRHSSRLSAAVPVLVVVLCWWVATDVLEILSPRILPAPQDVVFAFLELATEGFAGQTLGSHTVASIERWVLGVLLAAIVGLPVGILMGHSWVAYSVINPLFEALRYIPPFAWIPFAILWLGTGLRSQVLIVFIAALPPLIVNAEFGVSSTDPALLQAGKTLGATDRQILRLVSIKNALPVLLSGIRVATGNGWMALIGAELVASRGGLGFVIIRAQEAGRTDIIIFGMLGIGLVGAVGDVIVKSLSARALPWRTRR